MFRSTVPAGAFLFGIAALLFFAGVAHAESVQWNTVVPGPLLGRFDHDKPSACRNVLDTAWASVTYNVAATNEATGASVCGTQIVSGTRVKFTFMLHRSQDVYWTGMGGGFDTPYGDWVVNASKPSSSMCQSKNYIMTFGVETPPNDLYVALSVDPPEHSMQGLSAFDCGTPAADGSVVCTATKRGKTLNPGFDFTPTNGHFYWGVWWGNPVAFNSPYFTEPTCESSDLALLPPTAEGGARDYWSNQAGSGWTASACDYSRPYDLSVPAQQISCPITILDGEGDSPSKPTVSASGAAACTVGTPYSLTISAEDPDGDTLRYGIDWDANGTIDQFVPSTGYVPSGTSQTVSRTYATEGSKTVKVMAVDENGLTSSWATHTFSCTDEGAQGQGTGENLGGDDEGGGGGGDGSATPNLTIRAIPSLVRTGETTNLHWSASNVTACTVQGDGDTFQGTTSDEPQGNESSPITQQTTYTLSCTDEDDNTLTQSTTVNILPVWSEF